MLTADDEDLAKDREQRETARILAFISLSIFHIGFLGIVRQQMVECLATI